MSPFELIVMIGCVPVLWLLLILVSKVVVKNDLRDRLCEPVRVRWQSLQSSQSQCVFKVVYSDFQGKVHHASCATNWCGGMLVWLNDVIVE